MDGRQWDSHFSPLAGQKFGQFTEANIGKDLAIVLDNKVQSFPTIKARITTSGIIEGQFTIEEANDLAVMLQSGALVPAGLPFRGTEISRSVPGTGFHPERE